MIAWRGLAVLPACTLALTAAWSAGAPRVAFAESWRAVNIEPTGRIHLRQSASNQAKILAYIPGDARGLSGGPCVDDWCPIEFRGQKGWVFQRFLAPDDSAAADPSPAPSGIRTVQPVALKKTLNIVNEDKRPIPIYAFPNEALSVAGRLPGDTLTVEGLGVCIGNWCYVRSGALVGWLRTAMIKPDDAAPEGDATAATAKADPAVDEKALNKTEPTASQTSIVTAALPKAFGDTDIKTYTLAGLSGQNALPMREKPDGVSAIVALIPNGAKDVEGLRKCIDRWCLVRHGNANGWVARRHLADVSVESSQSFQVSGLALWNPLDVLDYPNADAAVIGQIPSYATGIVPIGGCDDDWCHIRYLGIAGWVKGENLEPQRR